MSLCQDYFGVALKSYFTPFASRGTAQKAKGGWVVQCGEIYWNALITQKAVQSWSRAWVVKSHMHHPIKPVIFVAVSHVCAARFHLFMPAVVLVFLSACINISLGETFIIPRPSFPCLLFMLFFFFLIFFAHQVYCNSCMPSSLELSKHICCSATKTHIVCRVFWPSLLFRCILCCIQLLWYNNW